MNTIVKCFALLAFAVTINLSEVSAQNALDFDGVNDMVTAANASNEINGSNAISVTTWVYATKSGGPYGIVGFRNNLNADFYILQLNATTLECRFRNGAGTNYDIVYSGFSLNQWQHYAMTYDGTMLRLYKNGVQVATQAATGTITNNTVSFLMGSLPWNTSNFIMGGKMDETSLWNKELSAAEVLCIYQQGVNPNAANLKLYYDYNHGTANANNSGITKLVDRAGNIDGVLNGFSLNGTSSNWVPGRSTPTYTSQSICTGDSVVFGTKTYYNPGTYFNVIPTSGGCDSVISLDLDVSSLVVKQNADICPGQAYAFGGKLLLSNGTYYDTVQSSVSVCDTIFELKLRVRPEFLDSTAVTICYGESYNFGTQVLTEEGLYAESFTSKYGCDSSIKVNLDVDTVNIGLSLNGNSLFANADQNLNTFQWIECASGTPVNGATNKFFPLPAGLKEYKVVVTKKSTNCSDTSECLGLVTGLSVVDSKGFFELYPNPVVNSFTIDFGQKKVSGKVVIRNIAGEALVQLPLQNDQKILVSTEELSSGIYFVEIFSSESTYSVSKLVRL